MRFNNNVSISWYTDTGTPSSTQYDWWSVTAHEMGHCLGLLRENDITNPEPVMFSTLDPGEVRRDLTADDIAGRNAIYSPTPAAPTLSVTPTSLDFGSVTVGSTRDLTLLSRAALLV